jgi:tetratricopeptide (TPR) repeat protein
MSDRKLAEKDVDATAAAVEEALKASGTPWPLKVIIGVVRMVLRHTTSQGKLEPEYAALDELHRMRQLEQLVRDAVVDSAEPLATAALEQLDANARIDGRLDQIVELLYRLLSERFGGPTIERPSHTEADFEGPGGVPLTPVADFSGRVEELQQLERALVEHRTVCVVATGIGGIGKTSLARQFVATRAAVCFPNGTTWLDATRLTQDLDRVCRRFGWSEQRELAAHESVAWLARALHDRSFLLIVDNVSGEVERDHIPRPGGRCRTLVTSRERALHGDLDAVRLELGVWSVAESLAYLRARCERVREFADSELTPLVTFVGNLPLGVKLLASLLIKRLSLTPSAALEQLRAQPVTVFEKYRGQNPGLVATFQTTYETLDEPGRRVLQAMAVCARQTRAEVVGIVAGVDAADELLDELYGHSLVEHDSGAPAPLRLHDVVRMFVAAQPGREEFEGAHLSWIEAYVKAHADVFDHVAFAAVIDEAVVAMQRLVAAQAFERAMQLYRPVQDHSRRTGAYPQAMALSEWLLGAVPNESGWASECLNILGICYATLGDTSKAIAFLQPALALDEQLGHIHSQASDLGNLGLCYRRLGDISKAIDFLQRALSLHEKLGHIEGQAANLGNLGICYQTLGDISKAIDFHQRALSLHEKLGRAEGQANQLGNLGICYRTLGDIRKAIDFHQRALALDEKLGRIHSQASEFGNLGICYRTLGDVQKAIDFHQRSLTLHEKLDGIAGQASQLGNLGTCYATLGDIRKAIDFHQRALALDEKLGSIEGQASGLGNLGICYQTWGDIPRAIDSHQRALALHEKLGSIEGQAGDFGNLGICYQTWGDIRKAIDFHQRALALDEKLGSIEGQANQLGNLGACYQILGDIRKAIDFHQRALTLDEKLGSIEGQANRLGNLGICYRALGDIRKAINFFQRSLSLDEKLGRIEGQAQSLESLALCHDALDQPTAAHAFKARAVTLREQLTRLRSPPPTNP